MDCTVLSAESKASTKAAEAEGKHAQRSHPPGPRPSMLHVAHPPGKSCTRSTVHHETELADHGSPSSRRTCKLLAQTCDIYMLRASRYPPCWTSHTQQLQLPRCTCEA